MMGSSRQAGIVRKAVGGKRSDERANDGWRLQKKVYVERWVTGRGPIQQRNRVRYII